LPPWAEARFDLAIERDCGSPFVCLSQATTHHAPPLDEQGFPILESASGARYLMERGIEARRIRLESLSLETIGNAYFTRLLHVDPAGWRRLLIITSEFHMPRTKAIFEWVFGLDGDNYELAFEASPNRGLTAAGLEARTAREQRSLGNVQKLRSSITTLRDFHRWLFTEHDAYSAEGRSRPRPPLDPATMESY
jgi:hypothetical protein